MCTKGKWIIDGTHIVSIDCENVNSLSETICDFNPDTEYPSVFERNISESFENAKIICKAPQMHEAIKEILEEFDGIGVINIEWIKNKLTQAIL